MLFRPWRAPEYAFALAGAAMLVVARLLPADAAVAAILREWTSIFSRRHDAAGRRARQEGLFDWTAVHAVRAARGSQSRLFLLVYTVGAVVTIFPVERRDRRRPDPGGLCGGTRHKVEPLPYLFVCAFVANAASFVLPISIPPTSCCLASTCPHLGDWARTFALPSVAAIVATFLALRTDAARAGRRSRRIAASNCRPPAAPSDLACSLTVGVLVFFILTGWDLGAPRWPAASLSSRPRLPRDGIRWRPCVMSPGACCRWSPACSMLVEGLAHVGAIGLIARHAAPPPPRRNRQRFLRASPQPSPRTSPTIFRWV